MASGWTHGNLDTESWDTWPNTGDTQHRNRWQPRSAVILSVDTRGGAHLRVVMCTSAASAPVAPSACYYNKSAAACSRECGGEAAPTPIPDRGPDRGWAHHHHYAAERPARGSYFCRPRYYLHHALLPQFLDIILSLSTHIYVYLYTIYCIVCSYLQSSVKGSYIFIL